GFDGVHYAAANFHLVVLERGQEPGDCLLRLPPHRAERIGRGNAHLGLWVLERLAKLRQRGFGRCAHVAQGGCGRRPPPWIVVLERAGQGRQRRRAEDGNLLRGQPDDVIATVIERRDQDPNGPLGLIGGELLDSFLVDFQAQQDRVPLLGTLETL